MLVALILCVSAFVPSGASEWASEDRDAIDRFFKAINTKYHDPDGVMGRRLQEGEPGKYRNDATPPHPRSHYGIPELVGMADYRVRNGPTAQRLQEDSIPGHRYP